VRRIFRILATAAALLVFLAADAAYSATPVRRVKCAETFRALDWTRAVHCRLKKPAGFFIRVNPAFSFVMSMELRCKRSPVFVNHWKIKAGYRVTLPLTKSTVNKEVYKAMLRSRVCDLRLIFRSALDLLPKGVDVSVIPR
jgi:hypothetical protein